MPLNLSILASFPYARVFDLSHRGLFFAASDIDSDEYALLCVALSGKNRSRRGHLELKGYLYYYLCIFISEVLAQIKQHS